jgi:hypothetical protein
MASNSGLPTFYATTRQGEAPRDLKPEQPSFFNRLFGNSVEDTPGLIPQKGYGNNKDGSTIDTQSELLWGAPNTARTKGVKQLFPRPFATTPNLSLGSIENIPDQSKVIFGHSTANRKSIQTVTDKQFPVFEPLLPEKEADIAENNYFVEPFLRGGLSSRLIPRVRVDLTK